MTSPARAGSMPISPPRITLDVAVDLVADRALMPRRDLMGGGAPPTVWAAVFVDGFVDFSTGVVTRPPPLLPLPPQPRCRP